MQRFFTTVGLSRAASSTTTTTTMNPTPNSKDETSPGASAQLALSDLKTVRWVQDQETLMYYYNASAKRYLKMKKMFLFGWYLLLIEIIVVWWWTFLHSLPLPQVFLKLLGNLDSGTVYVLDAVQRRTDWWSDVAGVRFMWFKESTVFFLDRNLTTADKYFAILQDRIYVAFSFFMKPVKYVGNNIVKFSAQKPAAKTEIKLMRNKNGSIRRISEGYEAEDHEDFADEDYLSDASLDSRRFMKEDSRGQLYTRHHTTAKAEGKFREAMYVRVRNELSLMRKNSIRFSTGIVNCLRQMVEFPSKPEEKSFRELGLRLAKKLRMLDLILTLQENMNGRPFLAKPLILIRVLSEAWLAFLLRLVRVKKISRRTRSMRSESLRRRSRSPNGMNNLRQLSPAALQQSSEPVQPHRLPMPATLQGRVQKLEEEDSEGFLSKDSALGSEDNRSEIVQSDLSISNIDEVRESDSDMEKLKSHIHTKSGTLGTEQTQTQLGVLRDSHADGALQKTQICGVPEEPQAVGVLQESKSCKDTEKSQTYPLKQKERDSSLCSGSPKTVSGRPESPKPSLCSGRQSPLATTTMHSPSLLRKNNQSSVLKKAKLSIQKHVTIQ